MLESQRGQTVIRRAPQPVQSSESVLFARPHQWQRPSGEDASSWLAPHWSQKRMRSSSLAPQRGQYLARGVAHRLHEYASGGLLNSHWGQGLAESMLSRPTPKMAPQLVQRTLPLSSISLPALPHCGHLVSSIIGLPQVGNSSTASVLRQRVYLQICKRIWMMRNTLRAIRAIMRAEPAVTVRPERSCLVSSGNSP
jgi:hypothetical protein